MEILEETIERKTNQIIKLKDQLGDEQQKILLIKGRLVDVQYNLSIGLVEVARDILREIMDGLSQ